MLYFILILNMFSALIIFIITASIIKCHINEFKGLKNQVYWSIIKKNFKASLDFNFVGN